ncbi:MAG: hypothetical protein WD249_09325 [Gaiellaceae bacterium]
MLALLGLAADSQARRQLSRDDPVGAARWIDGWVLVPFGTAIAAACGVIIFAVAVDPGDHPPLERKEIFSATSAALGAFLVAMFIKSAEEADEKWIGVRFKNNLERQFGNRFSRQQGQPASRGELAVKADAALGFSGWAHAARRRRAAVIAEELAKR